MLHDGGQGHREGTGKVAHRHALLLVEPGKQRTARRVGEGGEGAVEARFLIVNHDVNYWVAKPSLSRPDEIKGPQILSIRAWAAAGLRTFAPEMM